MNNRGSLLDLFYIMIVLVVFVLSTMIAFVVWEEYKGNTNSSSSIQLNTTTFDIVSDKADQTLQNFDYIFVFLLMGGFIMLIASVFTLQSHPMFFWISLLFLLIMLIIAGVFSNVYDEFSSEEVFEGAKSEYNIMEFVMDRLPSFMLFMVAAFLIALYGKRKFDVGGYG